MEGDEGGIFKGGGGYFGIFHIVQYVEICSKLKIDTKIRNVSDKIKSKDTVDVILVAVLTLCAWGEGFIFGMPIGLHMWGAYIQKGCTNGILRDFVRTLSIFAMRILHFAYCKILYGCRLAISYLQLHFGL